MVNGACPLTRTLTNGPGPLFKRLRYLKILKIKKLKNIFMLLGILKHEIFNIYYI